MQQTPALTPVSSAPSTPRVQYATATSTPTASSMTRRATSTSATDGEFALDGLSEGWNGEMVSIGHRAHIPGQTEIISTNGKEWVPEGLLRIAYEAVGSIRTHATRLSCHSLCAMATCPLAYEFAEIAALKARKAAMKNACWVWVQFHFDCTPKVFEFGVLQPTFYNTARFYLPVDEQTGQPGIFDVAGRRVEWKWMTLAEMREHLGGLMPRSGVLEMLAQTQDITYTEQSAKGRLIIHEKLLPRCMANADGGSSTLFKSLFLKGHLTLREICSYGCAEPGERCPRFLILGVGGDDAKQNGRVKAGVRKRALEVLDEWKRKGPGRTTSTMLFLFSLCIAHVLQGVTRHGGPCCTITGSLYAVGFVGRMVSSQKELRASLRKMLPRLLKVIVGKKPDAVETAHNWLVLKATCLRILRTKLGVGGVDHEEKKKLILQKALALAAFFNGGWWKRGVAGAAVLYHYCLGTKDCVCGGNPMEKAFQLLADFLWGAPSHPASDAK